MKSRAIERETSFNHWFTLQLDAQLRLSQVQAGNQKTFQSLRPGWQEPNELSHPPLLLPGTLTKSWITSVVARILIRASIWDTGSPSSSLTCCINTSFRNKEFLNKSEFHTDWRWSYILWTGSFYKLLKTQLWARHQVQC